MQKSTIQASKPGKLILLGEYAVLEQAPCLVAAVDKKCNIQIEPAGGGVFRLKASNSKIPDVQFIVNENSRLQFKSNLTSLNQERLRFVIAVLKNVIKKYGPRFKPATIKIDTKSFYHSTGDKLGLGASATIIVSLLSALREYIGEPLSGAGLYRAAFPIHRKAQGELGSGSDIAASAVGGVIKYKMPKSAGNESGTIKTLHWPENLEVIPVWAGRSASTQDIVQQVQRYKNEESSSYQKIMKPMIKLSEEGCRAFQEGDVEALQEIVTDFAGREQQLGEASRTNIISEPHRQIAAVVNGAGGTYKPSGAGNGDMGIAFCNGMESRRKVEEALEKSVFDIISLSLEKVQPAAATTFVGNVI